MRVKQIARLARAVKETALERDPATAEVPAQLAFYRGGDMVAMVWCLQGDPVWQARALQQAIPGFDASECVHLSDAYALVGAEIPEGGYAWGEFQARWEAGDRDGMSEVMTAWRGQRGSDKVLSISVPYVHDVDAGTITWGEENIVASEGGRMVRCMREGFASPSDLDDPRLNAGVSYRDYGLTREEARVHADCGMARALLAVGYAVALNATDDLAREIIDSSVENIKEHGLFDQDLLRETLARYEAGEFTV